MSDYINCVNLRVADTNEIRQNIRKQFLQTYELDEKIFSLLKDESYIYERPNSLRHQLIFYYGHTAAFFINKLILANIIKNRINMEFESIFAIGVDEMSWDDLDENHYKWPTFDEVKKYRDTVKGVVLDLIDKMEIQTPINWNSPMWVILMGIEHENIHIETSSVLLREMDISFLRSDEVFKYQNKGSGKFLQNELIGVSAAEVSLKKDRNDPKFYGWDNEFSSHTAFVGDFEASKYLVSNGEFMEFVQDGGYEKAELFCDEGKKWLNFAKPKYPHFWVKRGNTFFLREINREILLPLNYPVIVNFYEAQAFCNWKSLKLGYQVRLPSEDEYYRLYDYTNAQNFDSNIALKQFNEGPVDEYKFGDFYDVRGNVWQWSLTPIYPFNNFVTHKIYDDFTTPTFDDRHALIKGGSFISLGNETLRSARYAFRKHFFQHAGFRYVKSKNLYSEKLNDDSYFFSDAKLCEMSYTHTDKNYFFKLINLLQPYFTKRKKALDLGCLAGRSSFELTKFFDEVIGVEFSANEISAPVKLKTYDKLTFKVKIKDEIYEDKTIFLNDFDFNKNRVNFLQADSSNLKPIFTGFDFVLSQNIDRIYNPKKFLSQIGDRIKSGGILAIVSSYKFDETLTPPENFLIGFNDEGAKICSFDFIKYTLKNEFKFIKMLELGYDTQGKFKTEIRNISIFERL